MVRPATIRRSVRVAASNLVAVIGVTLFGWPAGALLVVYWVEAGIGLVRGVVQAPFARREPVEVVSRSMPAESWADLCGGVSIGPFPAVYPRNVPVTLSAVIVLLLFWPIAGAVVLLTVESALPVGSVLLAVGGVFFGQTIAGVAFFREKQYRDVSVRAAMGRRHPAAVAALALGGGLVLVTVGAVPTVLVVSVAVTKTLVEFAAELTDGGLDAGDDESSGEPTGSTDAASNGGASSDAASSEEPTATFRTDRRALLFRTAGAAPIFLLLPPYLFGTLGVLIAGLIGGVQSGLAALIVVFAVTVACRLVLRDVAGGHREYRVYPDRIVAYDRLLDTPQWSLRRTVATTASVESSRLDRVRPGGATVVVTTGNDEHRLPALRRPAAFVGTLGT